MTPRLFRKEAGCRYVHPIHEQLALKEDSPVMISNVHIRHHGYSTEEELIRKERRNLRIAMEMPDDDPHGLHSRARAAMKLEDWPLAYDSARSLLQLDSSPYKVVEGCVMLGIAAAKLGRFEDLDVAIQRANEVAPGNPDVRYLELVRIAHSYLDSIGEGEGSGTQEYLRPHMLWHIRERADTILAMLVGRPDDEPHK